MIKKILFLILIASAMSCKKEHMLDCFKSTGETTTQNRDVTPFTNIDLKDNVDLVIFPDTTFYIKVTAGENLIDGIITELSGGTLYIRNENRCNWMRSFSNTYTVEVGMDKPSLINYTGSGNISCLDTIRSDEFTFDCFNGSGTINFLFNCKKTHMNNHTGRSDIHAYGNALESYIYVNDVGICDASGLNSNYSYIRSSTTGECRVHANDQFGFEIRYNGNIYYSGDPVIFNQVFIGSGKLIHL